jgi:uncharacterized membrane protein
MEEKADAELSAGTPVAVKPPRSPATRFFLKGLAIILPSVLTLVILVWIAGVVNNYLIRPASKAVRYTIAQFIDHALLTNSESLVMMRGLPTLRHYEGRYRITREYKIHLDQIQANSESDPIAADDLNPSQVYIPIGDLKWSVPYKDFELVAMSVRPTEMPITVTGLYMEVVAHRYFQLLLSLSALAVILTIVLLYFIGRLTTARIGGWFIHKFETNFLGRLPLIRNVYSSVKQVTDFVFSERSVSYNRVVAIEYPRRGMWSLGFVTSDSLLEITAAAGEPLLSILMPTSPMPMTGFTVSVPRSEILDLNITIDQAFQYCLSCGVLVPPQQKITPELLQQELARRLAGETTPMARAESSPPSHEDQQDGRQDNPEETEASS